MREWFHFQGDIGLEVIFQDRIAGRAVSDILTYFGWSRKDNVTGEADIQMEVEVERTPAAVSSEARRCGDHSGIEVWQEPPYYILRHKGSRIHIDPGRGQARAVFESSLWDSAGGIGLLEVHLVIHAVLVLLRPKGWFPLHGAGLVNNGDGVLFVGPSGSGKSTNAFALVQEGWSYLSDDSLLLRTGPSDVEAYPLRRHFGMDLRRDHEFPAAVVARESFVGREEKEWINMKAMYPGQQVSRCTPRRLIFTDIVDRSESQIASVDTATAMTKLMEQSLMLALTPSTTQTHLEALQQLIRQTRHERLLAGQDLHEEPSLLAEILSSR